MMLYCWGFRPGEEYAIGMECATQQVGGMRAWILFRFTTQPSNPATAPTNFAIGRKLTIQVVDPDRQAGWAAAILDPSSEYRRRRIPRRPERPEIEAGEPPPSGHVRATPRPRFG